VVVTLLS